MLLIRRVQGNSMEPALKANQLVVGYKYFRKLQKGDVVIIKHQRLEKIKRIEKIQTGKVWLLGDNPLASTDSRHFGWIDQKLIRAKVWHKL